MADPRAEPSPGGGARTREDAEVEFGRIVAFSDGVFAIAITLLVLALDVPDDAADLSRSLRDQSSDFLAYALSFAVLGRLWLSHHNFFSGLARFDGPLMAINLLYLAWIALVPFSSELLGDYGDDSDAVIAYALNMVGVTLTFTWQLHHAARKGLVRPGHRADQRLYTAPTNLAIAGIFAASIPVALLSPTAATLMWLLIFVAGRWITRRDRRRAGAGGG